MATPQDVVDAILRSVENSGQMPSKLSYLDDAADQDGADSGVKLPVVEAEIIGVTHYNEFNTDFVEFTFDDSGNQTGRVYHDEYEVLVELDIWTAEQSQFDPDDLGASMRSALYAHTDGAQGEPFLDENGDEMDDIWSFEVQSGERRDDTFQTPTLRRWRQDVRARAYHEYEIPADSSVSDVVTP